MTEFLDIAVEIGPFTRPPAYSLTGMVHNWRYRRATVTMTEVLLLRSLHEWMRSRVASLGHGRPSFRRSAGRS